MTRIVTRVLLVLVLAALAGGAALAFSNAQPKEYAADLQFGFGRLLSPELQFLGNGFTDPPGDENIRMATEVTAVNSFDVAAATAKAAPDLGYTAGAVAGHVDATAPRDTLVVVLTARSSSPQRAARLANVYGAQYLALRRSREAKRAAAAQQALNAKLRSLTPPERGGVQGAGLRSQINTLEIIRRLGTGSPQVIQDARASFAPASPNTLRNVLFGVVFGLVVGIGLVALRSEARPRTAVAAARRGAAPARGESSSPE